MQKQNRVSVFSVIRFNLKLLVKEKSVVVMNVIFLILPIMFSVIFIFLKTGDMALIYLNFYQILFVNIFIFIIVLRILQFFVIHLRDNKLVYLTLTNEISRTSLLMGQIFICILNVIFITAWSSGVLLLGSFIFSDYWTLITRITLVFLGYVSIIGITLIAFISFLMLFVSNQVTTIIVTLVLSFTFVSALPRQLIDVKEADTILEFKLNDGSARLKKVSDIYDAFTLQKYITEGKIKYPKLSQTINNFFTYEQKYTLEDFSLVSNVMGRMYFWEQFGLINRTPQVIEAGGEDGLTVLSVPTYLNDRIKENDQVKLSITLKETFITPAELAQLIEEENDSDVKEFLQEFQAVAIELIADEDFQKNYASLYDDYVQIDEKASSISLASDSSKTAELTNALLTNLYQYNLTEYQPLRSSLTLVRDEAANDLVANQLYNPLMLVARIVEDYFINYTSNYVVVTSNPVAVEKKQWTSYLNRRSIYQWYNYINLHNAIVTNYTYYVGISARDLWFSPNADPIINLRPERNIFMTYVEYSFLVDDNKIIKPESYKNFLPPWIYLVITGVLILFFMILVFRKFNRIDLK